MDFLIINAFVIAFTIFTTVIRITFALRLMILLKLVCTKLATCYSSHSDYVCERVLDACLQWGGGHFCQGGVNAA